MTLRTETQRTSFSIVLAVALAACGPTIRSLRAEPNEVCRGSTSSLVWAASTTGDLTSNPRTTGLGPVGAVGTVLVSPTATTVFHLHVRNLFGHDDREADVRVHSDPEDPLPIGESLASPTAGCDASGVWVTATAPPTSWDSHIRIGRVASRDGRTYHVEHAGRTIEVTPDTPSQGLAGLELSGPWILKTPLGTGEACGATLPRNLAVAVYGACVP